MGSSPEQRMRELLAVTADLAAAPDLETVARLVVEAGRTAVDADSAGIWLLSDDGTAVELVASSRGTGPDPGRYGRLPLDSDGPTAEALRSGQAVFIGSREQYEAQYPASYARIMAIEPAPHRAVAVLPMLEGGVVGVMMYSYNRDREFDEASRTFKTLLARQCALAFERLRLRSQERAQREAAEQSAAAEKRARGDVERLYELIATANRLDSVEEIYELALHSVMSGSASDRAAILLKDPDGVMRFKAWNGLSDTYRRAVEGHTPWGPDQPFPAPIVVDDTEADPAWASYLDVFRAEGLRALAFVPIINREQQLIGKFMLYRNEARVFSLRDIQFSATVAVHIAQAVERKLKEREIARAYREEHEARLLADEATRAREEILSVVSHDLRNPLGAILMSASSLLHTTRADDERVRKNLERIHRQAERMARYIRDLIDFGSIEAGRISLERGQHKAEAIIDATSELFGPIATERGLKLEARIWPDLPPVQCDSERAVQVLGNLVSNALKVTPRGGAVSIGAEVKNNDVVFYVRDTGPGIDAEELPNLFERHWRSKSTTYKGAGLGLSIARGIVDAHGGKIWAESCPGVGSTFYFSLSPEN